MECSRAKGFCDPTLYVLLLRRHDEVLDPASACRIIYEGRLYRGRFLDATHDRRIRRGRQRTGDRASRSIVEPLIHRSQMGGHSLERCVIQHQPIVACPLLEQVALRLLNGDRKVQVRLAGRRVESPLEPALTTDRLPADTPRATRRTRESTVAESPYSTRGLSARVTLTSNLVGDSRDCRSRRKGTIPGISSPRVILVAERRTNLHITAPRLGVKLLLPEAFAPYTAAVFNRSNLSHAMRFSRCETSFWLAATRLSVCSLPKGAEVFNVEFDQHERLRRNPTHRNESL